MHGPRAPTENILEPFKMLAQNHTDRTGNQIAQTVPHSLMRQQFASASPGGLSQRQWQEGRQGNDVFSNEERTPEPERLRLVPISSVLWRRSLSRVKMNVLRTPLTGLAARPDAVQFNPERPPRWP